MSFELFMANLYFALMWGIRMYSLLLCVYAIMTWFPQAYHMKLFQLISKVAEPYISIFRRLLPPMGMIDFSIILSIFSLDILRQIIVQIYLILFR